MKHEKHGMCRTKFYQVLKNVNARCNNKNRPDFKYYGGRGIKCEWKSFRSFKEDMYNSYIDFLKFNKRAELDRINNNGNYCKENCRWSNRKTQTRNTGSNHIITFNNKTMCLSEWAEKLGFNYKTLIARINNYGWSIEEALNTPKLKKWDRHKNKKEV